LHLLDLLHSVALLGEEQHPQCPQQHRTLSAAPIELSYKSRAATVMGGAITAVAVIITDGVEVAAIIMVGGITVIGGDLQSPAHFEEAASGSGLFFISSHASNVADWHKCEVPTAPSNVRC
jgi:hypothetical protein